MTSDPLQAASRLSSAFLCAVLIACHQRAPEPEGKPHEAERYATLKFDTPEENRVQALILELYGLRIDAGSAAPTLRQAELICKELSQIDQKPESELKVHILMALRSERVAQVCEIDLLELLGKPMENPNVEIEWHSIYRWVGIVLAKAKSSRTSIPDLEKAIRYQSLAIGFIRSIYPRARASTLPLPRINDPKASEAAEAWLSWVEAAITNPSHPATLGALLEELGSLEKDLRSEDTKVSYKAVQRANDIQEEIQRNANTEARGISNEILKWLSSTKEARVSEIYMLQLLAKIQTYFAPHDARTDGHRLRFLIQKASAAKTAFPSHDLKGMYRVLVAEFLRSVAESELDPRAKSPPWPSMNDTAHEKKMDAFLEWLARQL